MIDFSIAAALINRFNVRLRDRQDAQNILNVINQRVHIAENNLSVIVEQNNLNRRYALFTSITHNDARLADFPQCPYSDLILFALGTYQLKQARSYYGEHRRLTGTYIIEVCRVPNIEFQAYNIHGNNPWLLRGRIRSRHIARKIYFVYILLESGVAGREGIIGYCCNCLVGRRTVGCCAHVMSVVWYLGWARYQENINPPAQFLDELLIQRAEVIDNVYEED